MYTETVNYTEKLDLAQPDILVYTEPGGNITEQAGPGGILIKPMGTNSAIESYGNITDAATGAPVVAFGKWFNIVTGEEYATWQADKFHVWANTDVQNVAMELHAKGYKSYGVAATALLQPVNDIQMQRSGNYWLLLLAAVTAFIVWARERKKKVGAITTGEVTPFLLIGGGLLAFSLVKQILEALGLWKSKDSKDLDQAATDASSFWNPNFWITVKPASASWSYAITEAEARDWCETLYDAFGMFNDNEEQAISVMKRCRTQANASFLAWVFQKYYNQDLLTFLRGGLWPQDRLSDADVNRINNYINSLPAY